MEERLEQHSIAYAIVEAKSAPILITAISSDVYVLLRGLWKTPANCTYAEMSELLKTHFAAQKCIYRERTKFYNAKQADGEPVSKWLSRIKQLAMYCEFEEMLDNVLRDKFITGLAKGPILDKACELGAKETLTKYFEVALKKETSVNLQFEEVHKINKFRGTNPYAQKTTCSQNNGNKKKASETEMVCYACGKGAHDFKNCKYREYVCKKCNKKGHLAIMCKEKTVQYLESDENEIFNLNCNVENEFVVQATVNGKNVIFQLDTGAAVSVMPEIFFKQHFGRTKLTTTTTTILKGYAGEIIKPTGCAKMNVQIGDIQQLANILVVPNGNRPLIGRDTMKQFRINVMQLNNVNQPNNLNSILTDFNSLFTDELGCYKHSKIQLYLKDEIAFRTVPLAFREKVDKELDRLTKRGIISQTEHSEWATPLVPVIKRWVAAIVCRLQINVESRARIR